MVSPAKRVFSINGGTQKIDVLYKMKNPIKAPWFGGTPTTQETSITPVSPFTFEIPREVAGSASTTRGRCDGSRTPRRWQSCATRRHGGSTIAPIKQQKHVEIKQAQMGFHMIFNENMELAWFYDETMLFTMWSPLFDGFPTKKTTRKPWKLFWNDLHSWWMDTMSILVYWRVWIEVGSITTKLLGNIFILL